LRRSAISDHINEPLDTGPFGSQPFKQGLAF